MNLTRFITYGDVLTKPDLQTGLSLWGLGFAVALFLITGLSLIYVKDLNRHLYSVLESFRQNHEELKIQRDQLLLEQNTWATQARVQEIARKKNMILVNQSSTMMVTIH